MRLSAPALVLGALCLARPGLCGGDPPGHEYSFVFTDDVSAVLTLYTGAQLSSSPLEYEITNPGGSVYSTLEFTSGASMLGSSNNTPYDLIEDQNAPATSTATVRYTAPHGGATDTYTYDDILSPDSPSSVLDSHGLMFHGPNGGIMTLYYYSGSGDAAQYGLLTDYVVAGGKDAGGFTKGVMDPLPEPAYLQGATLLALSATGLLKLRRRRSSRAKADI